MLFNLIRLVFVWAVFKFYLLVFSLFNNGEYSLYGNLVSPNYSPVMHLVSVFFLFVLYYLTFTRMSKYYKT